MADVQSKPLHLPDRLALKPAEAAEVLGISERTLRKILPVLPHFRVGERVVIPVEGLKQWLAEEQRSQRARADRTTDEILAEIRSVKK